MKRLTSLLAISLALPFTAPCAAPSLSAGAAASDITPKEFPLNMPGGFSANMAETAHDPLHARSIVLDDGTTRISITIVDTLGAGPEVLDEIKAIASEKTGIPSHRMLISSTHTHSGPSHPKEGPAPAVAYRKVFVEGVADSIVRANQSLKPAAFGSASHPLPDEVFNRRWYLKPGKMPLNPFGKLDTVKMNPGTSPDVLDRPAGPTDPDVSILSLQDAKRHPLALYANYALHYVGGSPKSQISADYFGEFARVFPSRVGNPANFVAMLSNGASGDINNIPFGITRPPTRTLRTNPYRRPKNRRRRMVRSPQNRAPPKRCPNRHGRAECSSEIPSPLRRRRRPSEILPRGKSKGRHRTTPSPSPKLRP